MALSVMRNARRCMGSCALTRTRLQLVNNSPMNWLSMKRPELARMPCAGNYRKVRAAQVHTGPDGSDVGRVREREETEEVFYSVDEVQAWKEALPSHAYSDDELMEWRTSFDELAKGTESIPLDTFTRFITNKYRFVITDVHRLHEKVYELWEKFDEDRSGVIDFGEFVRAGLALDLMWTKDLMQKEGAVQVFRRYAPDGYMGEAHFFDIMCDYRFFVVTATDMRSLAKEADFDGDGLVSEQDFMQWVGEEDTL